MSADVRPEVAADDRAIRHLHVAAFPSPAEADLVERLRADDDLVLSLVAAVDGRVIGHVALSRMSAPFRALGLGPIAVDGGERRRGIGALLIRDALNRAKQAGWDAIFVLGDPAYYQRFGFSVRAAEGFASPYAGPHLMVLPLAAGGLPAAGGAISYAPAFAALG